MHNMTIRSNSTSVNSLDNQEKKFDSSIGEPNLKDSEFFIPNLTDINKTQDSSEKSNISDGPCYMGICLPINIKDMFANEEIMQCKTFINQDENKSNNWLSEQNYNIQFNLNNFDDEVTCNHDKNNCLLCCRKGKKCKPTVLSKIPDCDENDLQGDIYYTEDRKLSYLISKHIQRASNPVWYKQSKQALLELKQAHPSAFQDICLYSDMCNNMSSSTYRLTARRFLQELFFDLNFNQFFAECENIITNLPTLDYILHKNATEKLEPLNIVASTSSKYNYSSRKYSKEITNVNPSQLGPKNLNCTNSLMSTSVKAEGNLKSDIPRVDVLNLICTKNKFPITNRITSQSIDKKNSLSNDSKLK